MDLVALIVDDNQYMRDRVLRKVKESLGSDWTFEAVPDKETAVNVIQQQHPLIVVADTHLDKEALKREGLDVLRAARLKWPGQCYCILYSRKVQDRNELDRDQAVDKFVFLDMVEGSIPFYKLDEPLSIAQDFAFMLLRRDKGGKANEPRAQGVS